MKSILIQGNPVLILKCQADPSKYNIPFKLQYINQVSKMNPDILKYLESDRVGKVLAKGLADLYSQKPQKPVKFLAEWLKSYSQNEKELNNLIKQKQGREENMKIYEKANQLAATNAALQKKKQEDVLKEIENFKSQIAQHQYQEELLSERFPEFIQKYTNITGSYVGELSFPLQQITDEDEDENAHLKTNAPKVIRYIGSSASHQNLMRGQVLALNQGVTGEVFELGEPKEPQQGEEAQEVKQEEKKEYVYVSNVVKNQKMHYFKLPKLGAYLAVPLVYESYLKEKIFDDALEQKLKFEGDLKEFNKVKEEQLNQIKAALEQATKKVNDLKEKSAEEAQIEEAEKQLKQIEERKAEKENQGLEEKESELTLEKRSFVLCVDNLGKDEELSEDNIRFILDMANHFKTSWQKKQSELLRKDVLTQVEYLNHLPDTSATIKQNYEKELQIGEESLKEIQQISGQNLKLYKKQQAEFNKLKSLMNDKEVIINSFEKLKNFRVVKYQNVIQNVLYFLNIAKDAINIPNRTVMDWKVVRVKFITKETFKQILNYVVQGPKEEKYHPYCRTTHLSAKFQAINEDEIIEYNIGLAMVVKFIKKALKHRLSNIELRKGQKEVLRNERSQIIAENDKVMEEKTQELQKLKGSMNSEELEAFNEEEWSTKYDEEHQLKQVPPEVINDIDNDL